MMTKDDLKVVWKGIQQVKERFALSSQDTIDLWAAQIVIERVCTKVMKDERARQALEKQDAPQKEPAD